MANATENPEELARLQQMVDADPQIQAILRSSIDWRAKQQQLAVLTSRLLPHGSHVFVDPRSGQLKKTGSGVKETLIAGGALAGGAALGGAFGLAGLGGGGGTSAASGLGPQLGGGAPGAGLFGAPAASGAAGGGAVAGAGGAGAAGAAGAGSVPGWLETILKVAPVGAGLVNHFAGQDGPGAGMAGQMPPELSELLGLSMQRMRDQEPLFQAVTKQALAGLPNYAREK